jgi:hypothetical protein
MSLSSQANVWNAGSVNLIQQADEGLRLNFGQTLT